MQPVYPFLMPNEYCPEGIGGYLPSTKPTHSSSLGGQGVPSRQIINRFGLDYGI
jgi:hypothetical protein